MKDLQFPNLLFSSQALITFISKEFNFIKVRAKAFVWE